MSESEKPAESNDSPEEDTGSQIPAIIGAYTARIRAISRCAREYIQLAIKACEKWQREIIKKAESITEEDGQLTAKIRLEDVVMDDWHYHLGNPHSDILSQSLLIFGFSAFDAYVGMLLTRLYREAPQIIYKLEEKVVKIAELVNSKNLNEVIEKIIERDVSNLLRNSYDDIFTILANRHGISTLKKFTNWPRFIEAAQRRNLITHCNGAVNAQYLNECKKADFTVAADVVPGKRLSVDEKYLHAALDILYEVGVMLGYTLWRTAAPDKIEAAENALNDTLFDLLKKEEWHLATVIGAFAIRLPDQKLDILNRISRINYAQSLEWSGDHAGAMKVLDAVDWSGSIRDLRLGVEILRGNYDKAAQLMQEIGKNGEIVSDRCYENWPIFRDFRKSEQFQKAFREIYGREFAPVINEPPIFNNGGPDSHLLSSNGESQMPSRPELQDEETTGESSPASK